MKSYFVILQHAWNNINILYILHKNIATAILVLETNAYWLLCGVLPMYDVSKQVAWFCNTTQLPLPNEDLHL